MSEFLPVYKKLLRDPVTFARCASGLTLRSYQRGVIEAIFDSVIHNRGMEFVVMFPRQSGKNELQAQLEVYLLTVLSTTPVEMIKVSPTLHPQALNAMRRLEKVMRGNFLLEQMWHKEAGNSYRLGEARVTFLSGAPESSIVGATANGLLEVDEAQDVTILKFDRDISPMTASTFATRVFWGTAWTNATLLSRQLRAASASEKADGRRRVFRLTADDVAAEVAPYRRHVDEMVARLGRAHPIIRTQYFSEEMDERGGMFPPDRIARMLGTAAAPLTPQPGKVYALLLDVAGEDEGMRAMDGSLALANPMRDATALTIVEISRGENAELSTNVDKVIHTPVDNLPVYTPVLRRQWIGASHTMLHNEIRILAMEWNARAVVVDATGVGAGLASFLERSLPGRVFPFTFNSASKSTLGWDFLGIVDSGRWREPLLPDSAPAAQRSHQQEFLRQLKACTFTVLEGAEQRMRWGVPDGARDAGDGGLLHDDWLLSAALCARLEKQDWYAPSDPILIRAADPLKGMEGKY